jgi:AcrR family transcriptional regulator
VPRPRLHATEDLLDAAAALAAVNGPGGVTMGAVAEAAGAPSGTLYHRFGNRAGLLAEVWLRTVTGFQAGYLEALEKEPVIEACVAAALHVVAWSRQHPRELRILLRGPAGFEVAAAPADVRSRIDAAQHRLEDAWRRAAARLPGSEEDALDVVVLATVELPNAIARRHLRTGVIPARVDVLLERSVRAIVADRLEG